MLHETVVQRWEVPATAVRRICDLCCHIAVMILYISFSDHYDVMITVNVVLTWFPARTLKKASPCRLEEVNTLSNVC